MILKEVPKMIARL